MILVPTDHGRVGVAPASEQHLLGALAAAARIQQRLDEVAERARAFVVPEPSERAPLPTAPPEPEPVEAEAMPAAAPNLQRVLTGIERTLIEERLAFERAAALRAAEEEREAAADAARMAAFLPAEAAAPPPATRTRRRGQWRRPAWLTFGGLRAGTAAATAAPAAAPPPIQAAAMPQPAAAAAAAAVEATPVPRAVPRPFPVPPERLAAYGMAVVPAIAAGIVWAAAAVGGRLDMPAEQLRPVAVALLATGPAGALAGLIAHTWFPRLLGLVAVTSLTALALLGRVLLG
jgi:hypothetical protein